MKVVSFSQIFAIVLFSINISFAQNFSEDAYYRLTTKWQGEDMSLDIINDGKNITPILAKTGAYSGQSWKITKVGNDIYTLTTAWRGPEMKLDCIQGPNQNRPVLNKSEYSGSAWKIASIGGGYYKITNSWLSDRSLDIINDGKNNKIQVAKTGNYTGQMWKITKISSGSGGTKTKTRTETRTTTETGRQSTLTAGQTLRKGSNLTCPNGNYTLKFQRDGNLAFYGPNGKYIWDAKTNGKGETCTLQTDGNFVIYDRANKPVWSTETMGYFDSKYRSRDWKPVRVEVTNAGFCGLRSATNRAIWTCGKSSGKQSRSTPTTTKTKTTSTSSSSGMAEVTIGKQVWMGKNLDVTTYSDGTPIPQVKDINEWINLKTGAWCYYNNDPALGKTYGKLYNWYAIKGIHDEASLRDPSKRKQLAPKGWRIPTENDFKQCEATLKTGVESPGGKMKEAGYSHWSKPNIIGTNKSGFTGLPGGMRGGLVHENFSGLAGSACFWTSTDREYEWKPYFSLVTSSCHAGYNTQRMTSGMSVRCLKSR